MISFTDRDPGVAVLRQSMSAAEQKTRRDLAALYRLAAINGWDDLIFTHISPAVPGKRGGGGIRDDLERAAAKSRTAIAGIRCLSR